MANKQKQIVVYGAGGNAREIEFLISRINMAAKDPIWEFAGYIVTDLSKLGGNDSKDLVIGDETILMERNDLYVANGIGTPMARLAAGKRLSKIITDSKLPVLIDPSVIWDKRSCHFEPGSIISAGCILTINITVGRHTFINRNCTIGHESKIGQGCVINPGANISGGVNIGDGVLVGTGASILQYLKIGNKSIIGAGALVTKNIPENVVAFGVPAKVKKQLNY